MYRILNNNVVPAQAMGRKKSIEDVVQGWGINEIAKLTVISDEMEKINRRIRQGERDGASGKTMQKHRDALAVQSRSGMH